MSPTGSDNFSTCGESANTTCSLFGASARAAANTSADVVILLAPGTYSINQKISFSKPKGKLSIKIPEGQSSMALWTARDTTAAVAFSVTDLAVSNVTFAYFQQNAVFVLAPSARFTDCTWHYNTLVGRLGAALLVRGDSVVCTRCNFDSNFAFAPPEGYGQFLGGAVHVVLPLQHRPGLVFFEDCSVTSAFHFQSYLL